MLYDMTAGAQLNKNTVVIVGDIHGHIGVLDNLLEQVIGTGTQMVFVGDYIDRGEHGVEVLTRVRGLCENPHEWGLSKVTALLGNHEKMVLDAMSGTLYDIPLWLNNGGRIEEFSAIREGFSGWLSSLPLYYEHNKRVGWRGETKKLFIAHASVEANTDPESMDPMTLIWDRHKVGYSEDHITVVGHTVCELGQPEVWNTSSGTLIRIDTGAAWGGDLAGVVFEEVDG